MSKEKPSMLGAAAAAAKKAKQQTSKPDSQIQIDAQPKDDEVNLCVRVPKSQRKWWAAQAKMNDKTMTDVIKKALIAEFGLPPK